MTQNKPKIWLSPPHMCGREQEFVSEAFDTNWIAPLGPHVDGFEKDLQTWTGVRHAAVLSSGTAAIHLALILMGVKAGDVVICQSFTFSASANPIVYQGATPVFVDSEPDTWNMDPVLLEKAVKACLDGSLGNNTFQARKPKAIIAVHLYGMPANMDEIMAISKKYDIPVVEDAAEALGSKFMGKACGSLGQIGILSFNGNKIITTSGGGALLSNDAELAGKASFLATQARDHAPHYQHSQIGYNYRMSNILAAVGRGQMTALDERVKTRRDNFQRYHNYFDRLNARGFNIRLLPEPENYFSNRWLTTITMDPEQNDGISAGKLRLHLEQDNIESRPLWKPMHLQPVFEHYPQFVNGISESLFKTGLCLPSGSNLRDGDFERIFKQLDLLFQ